MAHSVFAVQHVDDDSWRRELCPDCGARLLGLAAWKEHAPHHGWGSEWLAARVRAGRPGGIIRVNSGVVGEESNSLAVEAGGGKTWKSGVSACFEAKPDRAARMKTTLRGSDITIFPSGVQ